MEFISDDDLFRRLAFDNPWWAFTDATEIRFRDPPKRVFFPAFADAVEKAGDGRSLVVAGPLGAGKTVMVRQMVARLIEGGLPPANILYCALTTPSCAGADPGRLFDLFAARHGHGADAELYVFFDEIQYAANGPDAVRVLAAAHRNGRFVAALSSGAPAITTGPAPAGGGSVLVLPPLTFLEFLRFRGSEETLFGDASAAAGAPLVLRPRVLDALNAEFHRYVNFGGFPEGVLAKGTGAPAPAFVRDGVAERVLHKDLASLGGVNDAQELNRLFTTVAFNTGREMTMEGLAKAAGIAKNTLRKYLDYLEQAFLVRRVPRVDRAAKRFQRAVAFKAYVTTPTLYTALFGPQGPDSEAFPRLAETALVGQWLGAGAVAHLAYASWRGGGIDLLSIDPATHRPDHVYEIDWADAYGSAATGPEGLAAFVTGTGRAAAAYVLTRTAVLSAAVKGLDVTLAPLSLYAYWIGRDPAMGRFHAGDGAEDGDGGN